MGIPPATLQQRATREGWPKLYRGVWAIPGSADSPYRQSAAALAASPADAVLARRSAAWLHGLRAHPPVRAEVLLPFEGSRPRHDGLVALRSRSFGAGDVAERAGLRVTTVARTLGIPRLREVVNVLSEGQVDSMLEHDIRVGFSNARLPPPAREPVWLGSGPGSVQIDIAWPELRVGIEVDGWTLLRVGYLRWRTDRAGFIAEVRHVLDRAAWSLPANSHSK